MSLANKMPLNVDAVFGSLMVGYTAASMLFGVLTVQYYLYYVSFPSDGKWTKSLALIVWLLEFGHQISISHIAYVVMVSNYGDPRILLSCPGSIHTLALFACVVSFIVRGFYIYRLWKFSHSWILVIFLFLLSCAGTGLYMVNTVLGFIEPNLILYGQRYSRYIIAAGAVSASADVSVSLAMCWVLYGRKQGGGTASTIRVVDKLILWTFETGIFTSIFIVGVAISSGVSKDSFIWIAFWFVTCRAYSNSFFAVLNGRASLRALNANSHSVHTSGHGQVSSGFASPNVPVSGGLSSGKLDIEMSKVVHIHSDLAHDMYRGGAKF
ncbi:hypothetical protein DL96DRAFT_1613278 [Flagelloscypha sp. PMI_526]|nr:hypothetical protein DL96DRAFT_1613278 [Flagelloscypha sp. PMI_526]